MGARKNPGNEDRYYEKVCKGCAKKILIKESSLTIPGPDGPEHYHWECNTQTAEQIQAQTAAWTNRHPETKEEINDAITRGEVLSLFLTRGQIGDLKRICKEHAMVVRAEHSKFWYHVFRNFLKRFDSYKKGTYRINNYAGPEGEE